MARIRWRLRWLFLGLMLAGVLWIQLSNWIQLGQSPLQWFQEDPVGMLITYVGALLLGLMLDALAGYQLRPFFSTLARLEAGAPVSKGHREESAGLGMRFPAQAAMALVIGSVIATLIFHTNQAFQDHHYLDHDFWLGAAGNLVQELSLTVLLAMLLHTVGGRILHSAIAAHGLRRIPGGRGLTVGLQFTLFLLLQAAMYTATYIGAAVPPVVPPERLPWNYLSLAMLTALMGYQAATGSGQELTALAARLRALAGGVRPDLYDRQAVTSRDEVGEIAEAINMLQDRVEREFHTIERDLQAARAIQTGLLPRPALMPEGWDFAARLEPAQEVGGDFYDVIELDDHRIGIAVGDAAGKGLPAALLMASTVSLIRSHAEHEESPGALLSVVNRRLYASLPPATFVTAVYAVVDLKKREITLSSGGHLPPLMGGAEIEVPGALPLGVDPETVYVDQRFRLGAGESLVLLSDGVVEARNAAGELLGVAGLAPALSQQGASAAELATLIMARAVEHGEGAPQDDDMTVLVLRAPHELRLELPSRHGNELIAAREAAAFAREWGSADRADDIATAVAEGCLNGITHGNREQAETPLTVILRAGPGWFEALIADSGPLFTPPKGPPDLLEQMAGDRPIGGWGFHLIRSTADEVHLEPQEIGKQLRLRFYRRGDTQ